MPLWATTDNENRGKFVDTPTPPGETPAPPTFKADVIRVPAC